MRSPLEQYFYDYFTEKKIPFEEQVDVGPYQADFIIPAGNVYIDFEVDGGQHELEEKKKHDRKRDSFFLLEGFYVFRAKITWRNFNRKKQQKKIENIKSQFEAVYYFLTSRVEIKP